MNSSPVHTTTLPVAADFIVRHNEQMDDDRIVLMDMPFFQEHSQRPLYSISELYINEISTQFVEQNKSMFFVHNNIHAMYLCNTDIFVQEATSYFIGSKSNFHLIEEINDENGDALQSITSTEMILDQLQHVLEDLFEKCHLTIEQYQAMIGNMNEPITYHRLIFVADTRMEKVRFRPCFNYATGPLISMADHLYRILNDSFILASNMNACHHPFGVIRQLENYQANHYLKSTTDFIVIDMSEWELRFEHEQMMNFIKYYLYECISYEFKQSLPLSVDILIILIEFILRHQYCTRSNLLFSHIRGGNLHIPLIKLLLDISIYCWQKELLNYLLPHSKREICVRYESSILLTWNDSPLYLENILNLMRRKFSSFDFEIVMNSNVKFAGLEIRQSNGCLKTKLYRANFLESLLVQYKADDLCFDYEKCIYNLFKRALYCCTHVADFHHEYRLIYANLILHRYPLLFIEHCRCQFFKQFHPTKSNFIYTQETYNDLRHRMITTFYGNYIHINH